MQSLFDGALAAASRSGEVVRYRVFRTAPPPQGWQAWVAALRREVRALTRGHMWHCEGMALHLHVPLSAQGRYDAEESTAGASVEQEYEDEGEDEAEVGDKQEVLGPEEDGDGSAVLWYAYGSTRTGECVDDEWLIVWVLLQLTASAPQRLATVRDADGEFLLAEAALHLPQWVTPRAALRRVLLADGRVLLVPRPTRPDQLLLTPPALLQHAAVEAAAAADRRAAMALPPRAWAAVQKRVLRAAAASAQRHVCGATLPMAAAHVLQTPCLVAAAVRYYAQRDVVSMAALRRMHMFAAVDAPMVTVPIRLTRQLYAMLMHGELKPPPRSGFVLPPVDRIVERRRAERGLRLACGLEMAAAEWADKSARGKLPAAETRQYRLLLRSLQQPPTESVAAARCEVASDSEEWMNVTPEDVDALLNARTHGHADEAAALGGLVEQMKAFVSASSSYEGAEAPHHPASEEEDEDFYEGEAPQDRELQRLMDEMDSELHHARATALPGKDNGEDEEEDAESALARSIVDTLSAASGQPSALLNMLHMLQNSGGCGNDTPYVPDVD